MAGDQKKRFRKMRKLVKFFNISGNLPEKEIELNKWLEEVTVVHELHVYNIGKLPVAMFVYSPQEYEKEENE